MPEPERQKRCFVDTNIWLYALINSGDVGKHDVAQEIARRSDLVTSTQVINEACVNLLRKALASETTIRELIASFYDKCAILEPDQSTLVLASELREGYSLSFWDSLVVSSALQAGCDILYTEDLQDGLRVQDSLMVVNPF